MKFLRSVVDRLITREPVLFFQFAGQVVLAAWSIAEDSKWGAVVLLGVTLFQRAYSTPKAAADERVEVAKYVGAREQQATALAGRLAAGKRS